MVSKVLCTLAKKNYTVCI